MPGVLDIDCILNAFSRGMPLNVPIAAMATCEADTALSSSSLLDALVVPGLASACCQASDLRTMRLVSRGVRNAVHTAVQGYTLQLGISHCSDHPQLLSFLNGCRLLRLRINMPDVSGEDIGTMITKTKGGMHLRRSKCYHHDDYCA